MKQYRSEFSMSVFRRLLYRILLRSCDDVMCPTVSLNNDYMCEILEIRLVLRLDETADPETPDSRPRRVVHPSGI
jgi:hypothetical protein